uniref:Choline transporter-like protein n=1 Tax=Gadus morhua TaxID=8049 RepID=A0A8C5C9A4_GADMO
MFPSAWLHGDPRKVLHATDSYGQFCGQDGTPNAKKPILFYFNILKCANPSVLINLQCPTTQMCVSKCPDRFATYTDMQLQNALGSSYWNYYRQFCKPGFNNPNKPVSQVLRDEDCPSMIIPSRPFLQRCLPDFIPLNGTLTVANHTRFRDALDAPRSVAELRQAANGITGLVDAKEWGMKIVEDYAKSWQWILIGLLIAAAVSLTFILLLRFTAGLLLWVTILAVMLLVAYGTHWYYCYPCLFYTQCDTPFIYGNYSLYNACILLKVINEGICLSFHCSPLHRATGHIMSSLFYPLITFLLLALFISYWAVTAVANPPPAPMQTFNRKSNWSAAARASCEGSRCTFALYGGETPYHRYLFLLQLFNLLACLWLLNFSLALEQCTLAGAFASYYWARRRPRDVPPCPLFSSFSRAVRYHTGSLAFGSLILSVVQLARILLEYLDEKLRGANNVVARFIVCCLKCCFWCLERFIRYMNRNAYIMVAIYGTNFCTSAREAFFLLMRNVVRVAVLDRVTDFLLFLGKLLIAGGVGVLAFFVFDRKLTIFVEVPDLNFYWVPIVTVFLGSYLIAHGFFSVYAMCVDTLFLCFCEDLERNDGSAERPFFMSPGLHQLLGKSSPSR